jgi:pyrroloquinoline quinone (PQQ) biosynthesis protein C
VIEKCRRITLLQRLVSILLGKSKMEMLKTFAISLGLEPEKILSKEAMSKPYRTIINKSNIEESEIILLTQPL